MDFPPSAAQSPSPVHCPHPKKTTAPSRLPGRGRKKNPWSAAYLLAIISKLTFTSPRMGMPSYSA